jgi:vitamin B12 transporter
MTGLSGALASGFVAVASAIATAETSRDSTAVAPPDSLPSFVLPVVELRAPLLPDPMGPFPLATRRIGRDVVSRRPGADLHEVLLPIAGVRVTSTGSPGVSSSASIRGSTADQVLVLVDGRRWNPAQGGGVDLSAIPLESVESVEVFRGGASAFWGGDAVGGAIHVRTRRPTPGEARLRVAAGSHGEHNVSGRAAASLGRGWTAQGSGRFFETDGTWEWVDDRRGTTMTMENADLRRLGGDLRLDGSAGGLDLRVDAAGDGAERGVPGSEEFPTPTARLRDERVVAGVGARRAGRGPWHTTADVGWIRLARRYWEPGAAFGPVDDTHENSRLTAEAAATRIGDATSLRLAAGASHDRLDSSTDGYRRRRAFDLRAQVSRDHTVGGRSLRWMGAVRGDFVEDFDPFVSPRLGLLFDALPDRLGLRISFGLSYRTPSFDELFWPARATAAGNPDLRAERGRDLDVGLVLRLPAHGHLTVDAFVRDVDDLIQWTPGASGIWRPHNVGRARIAGVETEGGLGIALPRAWRVAVTGSATFLETRDRTGEANVDGRALVYRPRWSGAAGLVASRGRTELETLWRGVGDVWVTRANTKSLDGYLTGEVRARVGLRRGLALDAAVTNVTNEAARDFRDYPLPGRTWRLGFSLQGGTR